MALVAFEVRRITQEYLQRRVLSKRGYITIPDGLPTMEYCVHVRDTTLSGETMMTREELDEYTAFCARVRGRVLSELGIVEPEVS